MDENEIQIVLTAVDNASETIDKVNSSLGGVDGGSGFTASADVASRSADDLAGSFKGMTVEQLSYISTLGMSKEKQAQYNAALDEASKKAKAARDAIKSGSIEIAGMSVSMGAAAAAAGVLVVAIGSIVMAYGVLKSASDFAKNTTEDNIRATKEQIKVAKEYNEMLSDLERDMDTFGEIGAEAWRLIGYEASRGIMAMKSFILGDGPNFPKLVLPKGGEAAGFPTKDIEAGLKRIADAAAEASKRMSDVWSNIYGFSQNIYKSQESLAEAQDELNKLQQSGPAVGQSWSEWAAAVDRAKGRVEDLQKAVEDQTNSFIANLMLQSFTADNKFTDEERAAYTGFLVEIGATSTEAINTTIDAYNEAMGIIADVEKEVSNSSKEAKGDVDLVADALNNIKDKTVTITIITKGGEGWDMEKESKAAGGVVRPGQRALVGDKPGGIPTPWSEVIEALPGGGVRVYPNSQISAMRNMPSFAEGGTFGSDLTGDLSRMIRDLPKTIAMAIESTLQRSFR